MNNISNQTLASLVIINPHIVSVLEKYNLDFCCKGKRKLEDACNEKGLDLNIVIEEIEVLTDTSRRKAMPFTQMSAAQLIDHIFLHHHFYVKQSMPAIHEHLSKVASKHGDRFPYMRKVLELFTAFQEEMTSHMKKEELILFPLIKELEAAKENHMDDNISRDISGPILRMEEEHDRAGEIMFSIRDLTNNYAAPSDACTTFRISLMELKEFEDDLHEHVHLENNILFPKAQAMVA